MLWITRKSTMPDAEMQAPRSLDAGQQSQFVGRHAEAFDLARLQITSINPALVRLGNELKFRGGLHLFIQGFAKHGADLVVLELVTSVDGFLEVLLEPAQTVIQNVPHVVLGRRVTGFPQDGVALGSLLFHLVGTWIQGFRRLAKYALGIGATSARCAQGE